MKAHRANLDDYLSPAAAYHLARVTMTPSDRATEPHTHDFAEVFWVEDGAGTHVVNGAPVTISAGDLVLVRPADAHVLRSGRAGRLTIVNVAFGLETLTFLQGRYFDDDGWPWQGDELPATYRLGPDRLDRLLELTDRLVAGTPTRLPLERFLLELLQELTEPVTRPMLPLWLDDALSRLADDPEALTEGVAGLAALAGRSREHVNRELRQRTGRTATETINEIRLDRASRQLRMTDTPIARAAAESGFANLSHFYRLFDERFGTTPRRYRLAHQVVIRGGGTDVVVP